MIKNFFPILLIVISTSLLGCSTTIKEPEKVIVYKVQRVVIAPPEELLQKVVKPRPPEKQVYLDSSLSEREELLTDLVNKAMLVIDEANLTIDRLSSWVILEKNKQQEVAK